MRVFAKEMGLQQPGFRFSTASHSTMGTSLFLYAYCELSKHIQGPEVSYTFYSSSQKHTPSPSLYRNQAQSYRFVFKFFLQTRPYQGNIYLYLTLVLYSPKFLLFSLWGRKNIFILKMNLHQNALINYLSL